MLNDWSNLTCAHCGEEYLHHLEIQVFARPKEDGPSYRTSLNATSTSVAFPILDRIGNPSSRRSGVRVLLECELCPGISALEISQHKGVTQMQCVKAFGKSILSEDAPADWDPFSD